MMEKARRWGVFALIAGAALAASSPQALGGGGACCLSDGACIFSDGPSCDSLGGEYVGDGTDCGTAVCDGACCQADKTCSEGSPDDCDAAAGAHQGAGTTCDQHCPATLGTAFTYQGRLNLDGNPLTDSADFLFSLWDSELGNDPKDQVGVTVQLNNVALAQGLFTVVLDFGPGAFSGNERYLEVAVRNPHDPKNTESFTTLSPRQRLTGSPYAQTASKIAGPLLVPPGAVMFFNLTSCPEGWSELTAARGRYLVGLPDGGALLSTVGTSLSDQEERPAGTHYHSLMHNLLPTFLSGDLAATLLTDGGHDSEVRTQQGDVNFLFHAAKGPLQNNDQNRLRDDTALKVGTNAPFIQLLVCQKD